MCAYTCCAVHSSHVAIRDRYPLKDERPSPRRMIEIEQHLRRNSRCEMLGWGRITFYVHIRHLCVRIALSMSLSAIISRCSRTFVYNIGVSSFLSLLFSPASSLSSFPLVPRDISGVRPENKIATLFDVVDLYVFFLHNLARVCIINIASHTSLLPRVYTRIIHIYHTRGKQYAQISLGYVKSNVRERFGVSRNFPI